MFLWLELDAPVLAKLSAIYGKTGYPVGFMWAGPYRPFWSCDPSGFYALEVFVAVTPVKRLNEVDGFVIVILYEQFHE